MNKANCTTAAQQVKEADHLRDVINGIDSMCQTQLEQISSLVTVMLRAMETPDFWRRGGSLAELLGLMQYLADDLMNFVNASAEEVGCNYIDEVGRARASRILEALREASAKEVAEMNRIAARHAMSMEASHV